MNLIPKFISLLLSPIFVLGLGVFQLLIAFKVVVLPQPPEMLFWIGVTVFGVMFTAGGLWRTLKVLRFWFSPQAENYKKAPLANYFEF